jgi:hypothetical protein
MTEKEKNILDGSIFFAVLFVLGFGVTCLVQWGTGGMNGDVQEIFWWDWKFFCILWPFCTFLTALVLGIMSGISD